LMIWIGKECKMMSISQMNDGHCMGPRQAHVLVK
jgi:hypothetical protein